jgi:hypothetical protein
MKLIVGAAIGAVCVVSIAFLGGQMSQARDAGGPDDPKPVETSPAAWLDANGEYTDPEDGEVVWVGWGEPVETDENADPSNIVIEIDDGN